MAQSPRQRVLELSGDFEDNEVQDLESSSLLRRPVGALEPRGWLWRLTAVVCTSVMLLAVVLWRGPELLWRPQVASASGVVHLFSVGLDLGGRLAGMLGAAGPPVPWSPRPLKGGDYEEQLAEALAGLVKLSECGSLPGVFASAANGCGVSRVSAKTTSCQRAGLQVVQGSVRLILAENMAAFSDPVFGYLARYRLNQSVLDDGCLLVFRAKAGGSLPPQSRRNASSHPLANFSNVRVDGRALSIWLDVRDRIYEDLALAGCPVGSSLRFTGRALGGAVAAIGMFEAAALGFLVQPSVIFGARRPGDSAFAAAFYQVVGPRQLYHVTYNHDSGPRQPALADDSSYSSVGIEAYYPEGSKVGEYEVCGSGVSLGTCGIDRYSRGELTDAGACRVPLAPGGSFCKFPGFEDTCYLGQGYEAFQVLPHAAMFSDIQVTSASSNISLAGVASDSVIAATGTTNKPRITFENTSDVTSMYDEDFARFLAAMNKVAFCGPTAGVEMAVITTCQRYGLGSGTSCLPGTFRAITLSDEAASGAVFAYVVALVRRGRPLSRLVVFRGASLSGASGNANQQRAEQVNLVPFFDDACLGAMAHEGYAILWDMLRKPILSALAAIGTKKGDDVTVSGFSIGGAVAELAMYGLADAGLVPELSYTFEQPRVANGVLTSCIRDALNRVVPYFRITNGLDSLPIYPQKPGYADIDFEVHFPSESTADAEVCIGTAEPCGINKYGGRGMSMLKYHCASPLAPDGNLCFFGRGDADFFDACYRGLGV